MIKYNCFQAPIEISGLLGRCQTGKFYKLPDFMFGLVSEKVTEYGHRATGGRIRFRTDSAKMKIQVTLRTLEAAQYFSMVGSAGCAVIAGLGENSTFLGCVTPSNYETKTNELEVCKSEKMEDITIYFPRNELVYDVTINLEETAKLEAPSPFALQKPLVFYGSSITEGCTTVHSANSYVALTSRFLNMDYVNLGFSGAARGELPLAKYISILEMSAFIFDYDHNAPTSEFLQETHEPFFKQIRSVNPELPILMMSRPDFDHNRDEVRKRREIILHTYNNAIADGDENVYFLDGEQFFGSHARYACTIDTLHPNDTGMMRMAEIVSKKLSEILKIPEV